MIHRQSHLYIGLRSWVLGNDLPQIHLKNIRAMMQIGGLGILKDEVHL